MNLFTRLRTWLRESSRVHIREHRVNSLADMIDLIDRFLDEKEMAYPFEWDDFISWTNDNPNIEVIRDRLADTELLFFSKIEADRLKAIDIVLDERNKAAALVGIGPRTRPKWPQAPQS